MNCIYHVVIITILFVKSILGRDLPAYVSLCKRNDPNLSACLISAMNKIRPYLLKGIPEMDVPPGDPLHYYDFSASTAQSQGPLSLDARIWNQTATGFMNFDIKNISVDFEHIKFFLTILFPKTGIVGKYKFKGKLLLFQIDTTGDFEFTNITNILANAECVGKYYTKNSKQYIEFEEVKLHLAIETATVYFANLINGNEEVTKILNTAVNENINSLIEELREVLEQTFGGIVRLYFNAVFRLFPVDLLFPTT